MTFNEKYDRYVEEHNKLLNETGIFWAFSHEQFEENRTHKETKQDYISLGLGGYIHKLDYENFMNFMENEDKKLKEEFKKSITLEELIDYQLINYECYYTGEPLNCLDAVKVFYGEDFTDEELVGKIIEIYEIGGW